MAYLEMLGIARWLHAYIVNDVIAKPGIRKRCCEPRAILSITVSAPKPVRPRACHPVGGYRYCRVYPVVVRRRRSRSHAASISADVVP